MKNKRVVFDIDGVLADFEKAFCEKFGWDRREEYSLEKRYPLDKEEIHEFVSSPSTYANLDTVSLGVDAINFMAASDWEISVVSYRPDEAFGVTFSWLKKNKIPFLSLSASTSSDKIERIKKLNPLFVVEDSGQVAEKLAEISIPTVLIAQPYNRSFSGKFPRVGEFEHFLSQFYRISGGL